MSPPRLVGVLPQTDYEDPETLMWNGRLRIVHRQRARKLRRRGERLIDMRRDFPREGFKACYGWVVAP